MKLTLSGYVDTGKRPESTAGLFGVLIRLHAPIISQHNSHRLQCGPAYGFLALAACCMILDSWPERLVLIVWTPL